MNLRFLKNRIKQIDRDAVVMFLATGAMSGNSPVIPGTAGSAAALLLCWLLSLLPLSAAAVFLVAFIVLAVWAAELAEKIIGVKDPGQVVIDEFAGMMITLLGMPFTIKTAAAGFLIFRILDILKPGPIRYLERAIPGGAGIVMDDVAAGVAANLLLKILLLIPWMAG